MGRPIKNWGRGAKFAPPEITEDTIYTLRGEETGCVMWGMNGECPTMDLDAIYEVLSIPTGFFSIAEIKLDQSTFGNPTPTYHQHWLFWALHEHQHVFAGAKPRQIMYSVGGAIGWLLRDCMYFGLNGYLYAHRQKTAETLHNQIVHAYEHLPLELKVPLKKNRQGTIGKLFFESGGSIQIESGASKSPGAGTSPDRLHVSELGEMENQLEFSRQLFPAYDKRPKARGLIETTPGKIGTWHRKQWDGSITSMGQSVLADGTAGSKYFPLFPEWWFGTEVSIDPPINFAPTAPELELLSRCPGMNESNLQWRRLQMASNGWSAYDFELKYPSSPYHGWGGADRPTFPPELLSELLLSAISDVAVEYNFDLGASIISPPVEGHFYYVFADNASLDGDGDPSAITIFNQDWEEVAFYEAVEASDKFAYRLLRLADWYNNALIVVEANEASCLGALKNMMNEGRRINLYYADRGTIGWRATGKSINEAEGKTLKALREGDMKIYSTGALQQLLSYSGVWRKRRVKREDGSMHHFDRARTILMAGWLLPMVTRKVAGRVAPKVAAPVIEEDNAWMRNLGQVKIDPEMKRRMNGAVNKPIRTGSLYWQLSCARHR